MVNSINSVNGATPTTATQAVSKTEKTEEVAKKEEQAKKVAEKKETEEKEEISSYAFDKETLRNKIHEYIEKLKKAHDYPMVHEQLDSYVALLNMDKFMKTYPNITTDIRFNEVMYNETLKYL